MFASNARPEEMSQESDVDSATLEVTNLTSFAHVCHPCGSATRWNPIAVLWGLLERDDLTFEQRREIAETLSTRAVSFEVNDEIEVTAE